MDITSLKEAGLTEGEIKVYLALLEIGLNTTGPIIERSGIAKSIIYQILERLIQKGLVSYVIKDKTKHYQASDPQKIIEFIEIRKSKLEENKAKIEKLLPELILKQSMAEKSQASMYFGLKGIRTAHEHTYQKLKKGEEYVYLGIHPDQPEEFHLYWQRDHVRRSQEGIKCKLLFNHGTDQKILKNRNSYKDCEAREMKSKIKTPASFLIYKDTVTVVLQFPEAIAIEIINQGVADSFMEYFNEFWNESEVFKK